MVPRLLAPGALAALILLSACGSTAGPSGGGGFSGTPSGQEAAKTPSDIIGDATTVLQSVDSYTVSFSGTDQLGPLSFTLKVDTQSNATGTMSQNGQTSQVVFSGTNMYVQQFALAQLLWQPVMDASSYSGKWVVLPTTVIPYVDTFRTPTVLAECAQEFVTTAQAGNQTTINGVSVIPLISNDDNGNKNIISVALDGSAHLLAWEVKAAPSTPQDCLGGSNDLTSQLSWAATALPIGTFSFTGYQAPVDVVVPNTTLPAPTPTDTPGL